MRVDAIIGTELTSFREFHRNDDNARFSPELPADHVLILAGSIQESTL